MIRVIFSILIFLLVIAPFSSNLIPITLADSPTSVEAGTSTYSSATWRVYQRKVGRLASADLDWIVYGDGSDLVFSSSSDGTTWATPISLQDYGASGLHSSVYFNESDNKLQFITTVSNNYYQKGTINSDGSFTWDADKQLVSTTGLAWCDITVDSNGYPWVGGRGNWNETQQFPVVTNSSTKDGTWTEDVMLNLTTSDGSGNWYTSLEALNDGKVMAIYNLYYTGNILSCLYNGSEWETQATVSDYVAGLNGDSFSTVADGDNIHLVYVNASDHDLRYVNYTYGSGWGTEVLVEEDVDDAYPALSIDKTNNRLYVFWSENNHIYYKEYNDTAYTWGDTVDWITSTDTIGQRSLSASYRDYDDEIQVIWTSGSSSPYSVNFNYLSLGHDVTLQARDTDGTNLPRAITFTGTYPNGRSLSLTSDSSGAHSLMLSGNTAITTRWGTHTIDSRTVTVSGDKTENIDTTLKRLDSGSNYLLMSVEDTTIDDTPTLTNSPNWKVEVMGTGEKEFKIDLANWVRTTQPVLVKLNGYTYRIESGWSWDSANSIFTWTINLGAYPWVEFEMSWTAPEEEPSSTTIHVTPENDEDEANETSVSPYILPYQGEEPSGTQLQITSEQVILLAGTVAAIVIVGCVYDYRKNKKKGWAIKKVTVKW